MSIVDELSHLVLVKSTTLDLNQGLPKPGNSGLLCYLHTTEQEEGAEAGALLYRSHGTKDISERMKEQRSIRKGDTAVLGQKKKQGETTSEQIRLDNEKERISSFPSLDHFKSSSWG